MTTAGFPHADLRAARGMTLLEVLISCGVLVVGLASIASLLPAAGSRLGQATTEDRGGTLAANARADAFARGLVAFDLFADANKALAFGKGMTTPPTGVATLPAISAAGFAAPAAAMGQRVDPLRGFLLEDEVMFSPPTDAETPLNDFLDGRRVFKEGICWGATLVPQKFPARAGSSAVLGVAVFRREGQAEQVPLTTMPGGVYRMTTPDEEKLKKFLRSCSFVLVPGTDPAKGPRWFRITASWRPPVDSVTNLPQNDGCYVVFADSDFAAFAGADPTVIGFENLIRVDQYNVILQ